MHADTSWIRPSLVAVAALACLIASGDTAQAQGHTPYLPPEIDLELPANVEQRTWRFDNRDGEDWFALHLSKVPVGRGYELTIEVVPSPGADYGCPFGGMEISGAGRVGAAYRQFTTTPREELVVSLLGGEVWKHGRHGCDVVITVSRRLQGWTMWV